MFTAVLALHILVSILLIFIVLIQGGENVDITAAFGGVSQAAFGPRGAVTTLQKATWVLGLIFMITAVTLAVWATKTPEGSPLRTRGAPASQTTPAATPQNPAPSPTGAPATTPTPAPSQTTPSAAPANPTPAPPPK
jgi:preprotein translocase subunit SecG